MSSVQVVVITMSAAYKHFSCDCVMNIYISNAFTKYHSRFDAVYHLLMFDACALI